MADELVAILERINEGLVRQVQRELAVEAGFARPSRDEDVCQFSWLVPTQCAHCQGHVLEPDLEEIVRRNLV